MLDTLEKTGAEGIQWNLNDLYQSLDDPALEQDLKACLSEAQDFEKDYRGQVADLDAGGLLKALERLEGLSEKGGKAMSYVHLVFAGDTSNPKHGAKMQQVQEKLTEVRAHVLFFDLEWLAVPEEKAQRLIQDPVLAHYAHHLRRERAYKPHRLSEGEERVMDELSNVGGRAFARLFDETLNNIPFPFQKDGETKEMSEQEILSLLYGPDRDTRRAAADGLTAGLRKNTHLLTFIFNHIVQNHAIDDRLRKFGDPMQSRHLANEIQPEAVEALLKSSQDNYGLVADYYRLKKAILGYDKLFDYDRYAPLFADQSLVPYDRCRDIVLGAFGDFSPKMRLIAEEFFSKNWIDAEIRPGKRGGAFSASTVPSVHPYILVNYTGRLRDVMTVAHELGHGIHQYLSRPQGYFQADTPLTTAEMASVFAEFLTFERLKKEEQDPRKRLALLSGKLEDIFSTVFRQVVMTVFERSLHDARRNQGELTHEQISELWMQANQPMFGDSVELRPDYGMWWMYIPHFIHSPFYCYAYSFGILLVLALFDRYKQEGEAFVPKYLDLLASGGSDRPEKLLAKVGVNVTDPNFWQGGLMLLRGMVDEALDLGRQLGYSVA